MKHFYTLLIVFLSLVAKSQDNKIGPTGFVGIGITNPESKLHVRSFKPGSSNSVATINVDGDRWGVDGRGLTISARNITGEGNPFGDKANYGKGLLYIEGGQQWNDGNIWRWDSKAINVNDKFVVQNSGRTELWEQLHVYKTGPSTNQVNVTMAELKFTGFDGSSKIAGMYTGTNRGSLLFFTEDGKDKFFERMRIDHFGRVGIGTTNPDALLSVNGTIHCTDIETNGQVHCEEVLVDTNVDQVPDYVFEEDYDLRSLEETKSYIQANKHLPEVPSAVEMSENGMNLTEMNLLLLKKIEELTLHVIRQQEEMSKMKVELNKLKQ
ncbi:hypothetical protein [Reichenbachiella versicolor]|uniref:hypothetical protein n=1 Tax=Reichenbachiella versicolor TaxID=1821036 RepID=UPI000D6E0BE3|nr:hypothetical protein [Reichenbachiella versicolor]